ncbi:hypothetical protein [Jiulongibacter sp. NS-SX5]|uniref:hypothetical protein n=1 Tax=Jiulongibacter sp. NS-SX5 TaxID=3463854 RepID=UPI0040584EF7
MKRFFLLAFVLISFNCFSATITWDGGAGTHNWGDPANWDTNTLPAVGDDVIISSDSVVLNISASIKSLEINSGRELNVLFGLTLNITGSSDIGLALGAATLYNSGTIRIINPVGHAVYGTSATIINGKDIFIEYAAQPCDNAIEGIYLFSNCYFYNGAGSNVSVKKAPADAISLRLSCTWDNWGSVSLQENCGGVRLIDSDFNNKTGGEVTVNGKGSGVFMGLDAIFYNEGTFRIDSLSGTGTLNPAGFVMVDGSFQNSSLLEIKNVDGIGFYGISFNSFINSGTLVIENTGSSGIQMHNPMTNNGNLLINNAYGSGIIQDNSFLTNTGIIEINNVLSNGIFNHGSESGILNLSQITVNETIGKGIYCQRDFTNTGDVSVINTHDDGMVVDGTLSNQAAITIDTTLGNGLVTNGLMFNTLILNVKNTSDQGITASKKITNLGTINISNTDQEGVYTSDTLINSGSLNISNTSQSALQLNAMSTPTFFHNNGGNLSIRYSSNDAILIEGGGFLNEGDISVRNVSGNAMHILDFPADLINKGTIELGVANLRGMLLEFSNFAFLNDTTGVIEIDTVGHTGINSEVSFINHGQTHINNAFSYGVNIELLNRMSSSNTSRRSSLSNLELINSGELLIENTNNTGIGVKDVDIVNSGEMEIDGLESIIFERSDLSTRFYNARAGTVKLASGFTFIEDLNPSTNSEKNLNDGLIDQGENTGENTFKSFLNNGVFVDRGDKLTANTTGFTNSGIIVKPQVGVISKDIKEMDIIHAAAKPAFTVGTSWFDPLDTGGFPSSVGTYSPSDQSFKPRGVNASSLSGLKLTVSYSPMSLIHEITIPVIKKTCSQYYTMSFTGSNSDDWHTPENWDNGRLPDPCSTVTIPSGMSVRIPGGTYARTYRFLSETGSVYEAEAGAVLENLK